MIPSSPAFIKKHRLLGRPIGHHRDAFEDLFNFFWRIVKVTRGGDRAGL